jgi:hypothetical protein
LKIPLVEDNIDTLRHLGLVLRRHGHMVTAATSVGAARAAAATGEIGNAAGGKYMADRLLARGFGYGEWSIERVPPDDPHPL